MEVGSKEKAGEKLDNARDKIFDENVVTMLNYNFNEENKIKFGSNVKMGEKQQLFQILIDKLKAMDQMEDIKVPSDGGFMANYNNRSKIGAKNVITMLNYNSTLNYKVQEETECQKEE